MSATTDYQLSRKLGEQMIRLCEDFEGATPGIVTAATMEILLAMLGATKAMQGGDKARQVIAIVRRALDKMEDVQ